MFLKGGDVSAERSWNVARGNGVPPIIGSPPYADTSHRTRGTVPLACTIRVHNINGGVLWGGDPRRLDWPRCRSGHCPGHRWRQGPRWGMSCPGSCVRGRVDHIGSGSGGRVGCGGRGSGRFREVGFIPLLRFGLGPELFELGSGESYDMRLSLIPVKPTPFNQDSTTTRTRTLSDRGSQAITA